MCQEKGGLNILLKYLSSLFSGVISVFNRGGVVMNREKKTARENHNFSTI